MNFSSPAVSANIRLLDACLATGDEDPWPNPAALRIGQGSRHGKVTAVSPLWLDLQPVDTLSLQPAICKH
jgi:hypothetical protein